MTEHVCTFVEEQEPSGRLIVGPCLECNTPAMEALTRYAKAEDIIWRARLAFQPLEEDETATADAVLDEVAQILAGADQIKPHPLDGVATISPFDDDEEDGFRPLDPYPWVLMVGPWKGARIAFQGPETEFKPRPEFEQDQARYPRTDTTEPGDES